MKKLIRYRTRMCMYIRAKQKVNKIFQKFKIKVDDRIRMWYMRKGAGHITKKLFKILRNMYGFKCPELRNGKRIAFVLRFNA